MFTNKDGNIINDDNGLKNSPNNNSLDNSIEVTRVVTTGVRTENKEKSTTGVWNQENHKFKTFNSTDTQGEIKDDREAQKISVETNMMMHMAKIQHPEDYDMYCNTQNPEDDQISIQNSPQKTQI